MKRIHLVYLLFVIFLLSGSAKILALPFELAAFARWGYPLWFMYATGIAEVVGALLLLGPMRRPTAAALTVLMLGAVATHALHSEWPMLIVATLILLACAWVFRWQISDQTNDDDLAQKSS
ncbi:DoxX family protein [Permianibacter aggregans]|uniref:DoxX-like protein n=1 Tax=Permianibacter aggregans TaxID=1510150 RepID=A0A4R6UJG1_9GAMM|nr:DoxX family protein [Permianibacter aggregans]QGX39947.1 DoxX family protein [Permianibacter aggregans]TDQ46246.1 DoxX-like protein [Permianibacter aggregans]